MAVAIPFIMMAVAAAGSIKQSQAQESAAKYNQAIQSRNAVVAMQQADADAEIQGRIGAQALGRIKAGVGAAGVTMDGSPLDVLQSSASLIELDKQTIIYKGQLRAIGYGDAAGLAGMQAKNASDNKFTNAGMAGASAYLTSGGSTPSFGGSGATSVPMANNGVSNNYYGAGDAMQGLY